MAEAVAYVDGASRGNPGPAGYGIHIVDASGRVIHEAWRSLGKTTNNVAEYEALLAALAFLVSSGVARATIRSDSQLLVRQMRGEYRVRHPRLVPLYNRARLLAARLDRVSFEHIPREANTHADRLANLAIDEAALSAGRE